MDHQFTCACRVEQKRECTVSEREITISVDSAAALIHHVLEVFNPEHVYDYCCNQCQARSNAKRPATRQRFLLSPRFLRINIVAPLTSEALPIDFHQYGPLREYETLDLSQLTLQPQRGQALYTLRAAIMYSKRHHWAYLYGHTPTFVSDDVSRVATPSDMHMVALCARILIYKRTSLPYSCSIAPGLGGSVTAMATKKSTSAPTLSALLLALIRPARIEPTNTKQLTKSQTEHIPTRQGATQCDVPDDQAAGKTRTSQNGNNADAGTLQGSHSDEDTHHSRGTCGIGGRQQCLSAVKTKGKTQRVLQSVKVGAWQRPPPSPSHGARTDPKQ